MNNLNQTIQNLFNNKKFIIISLTLLFVFVSIFSLFLIKNKKTNEDILQIRVNRMKNNMNLAHWVVDVKIDTISKPSTDLYGNSTHEHDYGAKIEIVPEYYTATIIFNSKYANSVDNSLIKHELLHIHMTEYRNYVVNNFNPTEDEMKELIFHEERLVELLSR